MAELDAVLATVRDRIARYQGQGIGEQDTKATLIVPVLRALGWDVEDLEDVKLEYKRKPADNPVDYALVLLREPRLFIEAKSLGLHLDDQKWATQFLAYAMTAGVEWVALTDGNEWRLYNSHATVPVEQKLFRTVRVADPATRPGETLSLLSKAQLQDNLIDLYWKSEFVDRQVGETLRALFAGVPDPAVVRLVHGRLPTLARPDVRASLGRLRANFDFPVVPTTTSRAGPVPDLPAVGAPRPSEPRPKAPGKGTPGHGVTLGQLIDAGLIRVPLEIVHRGRAGEALGLIEAADRVVVDGVAYASLSIAGGAARRSMRGEPLGAANPATNGWTFWELHGADGQLHPMDALRRQLHDSKVVDVAGRRTV